MRRTQGRPCAPASSRSVERISRPTARHGPVARADVGSACPIVQHESSSIYARTCSPWAHVISLVRKASLVPTGYARSTVTHHGHVDTVRPNNKQDRCRVMCKRVNWIFVSTSQQFQHHPRLRELRILLSLHAEVQDSNRTKGYLGNSCNERGSIKNETKHAHFAHNTLSRLKQVLRLGESPSWLGMNVMPHAYIFSSVVSYPPHALSCTPHKIGTVANRRPKSAVP